ncbi:unnamed protein product [Aphanomyces euteiches]
MLSNLTTFALEIQSYNLATVVTTASAILVSAVLLRFLWKSHQLRHIPQPPPSNLLLGHLFDVWGNIAKLKTGGHFPQPFLSWMNEYGGVVHLREVFLNFVLITDPVALQHILLSNGSNFPRLAITRAYIRDITLGDGLFSVEGKQHDDYRKVLNPIFTVSKIKTFVEIFNRQVDVFCERYPSQLATTINPSTFQTVGGSRSLELLAHGLVVFTELTLSIIGLTVLGYDFEKSPVALQAYNESMVEVSPLTLVGIFTIPGFLSFPIPSLIKRRKAQATLRKLLMQVIEDKLAAPVSETPKDLLDVILPHATTQEALSHTVTFMMAGHDTSSNTLGFIFCTLASHPQVNAAICEEYHKVISKYGSLKSWEAVSELKYTYAVIQETLRLNPVVFSTIQRISLENDRIPMADGSTVFLPKGTPIHTNMAALQRNPKYWKDPESFIPQRFIDGTPEWNADLALRGGKSHAFYYMPFSAGSKLCIGQRFAVTEMQVVVATLVSKYELTPTAKTDMRHCFSGLAVKPVLLEMKVRRHTAPCA